MKVSRHCSVIGCTNKFYGHDMCSLHYQRWRRGKPLDHSRFDKNEIRIVGDIAYITLYGWGNVPKSEAIIDAIDVPKVLKHRWGLVNGYVGTRVNGRQLRLHRLIGDWPHGDKNHVDHIDGNPLNNRRSNLRLVSVTDNHGNKRIQRNNRSGLIGVWYRKDRKVWTGRVTHNGIDYNLGSFQDADEAAKAYNAKKVELYGEQTVLNPVD